MPILQTFLRGQTKSKQVMISNFHLYVLMSVHFTVLVLNINRTEASNHYQTISELLNNGEVEFKVNLPETDMNDGDFSYIRHDDDITADWPSPDQVK